MHKKPGYILVLSLLMVSVLVIVVTQVFYQASSAFALSTTLVKREKAKVLALSGIQLAISQLTILADDKKKEAPEQASVQAAPQKPSTEGSAKKDFYKKLLEKILPTLNRWQEVEFTDKDYSFDGQIKFCISAEDGKINLNAMYDFERHQFKNKQYEQAVRQLLATAQQITGQKNIIDTVFKFLKERKFPLNDITELLEIKDLEYFKTHVFYDPTVQEKPALYLTDLCTTYGFSDKLQPWLLSNAVLQCLGLPHVQKDDSQSREQMVPEWLKKFDEKSDWPKAWNTVLKPVYGKDFSMLNKDVVVLFNQSFVPKVFSVVSYGTFGDVTQKCYAILQFQENRDKVIVFLEKVYWL